MLVGKQLSRAVGDAYACFRLQNGPHMTSLTSVLVAVVRMQVVVVVVMAGIHPQAEVMVTPGPSCM